MSIVNKYGVKVVLPKVDIERPIALREFRSWGMKLLYYRVGLSLNDIGKIFGIGHQAVSYHINKLKEN